MKRMTLRELLNRTESKYSMGQILRWLWRAWRGNQLQAVLNAMLGLLGVGVSLTQVWAVQHAIDVASHTIDGSLPWAVAFMGLLILCNFAISISAIWVRNILGIRAQNRMQQRMLDRILRSEWRGRDRLHSGDVINRLEKDVNNIIGFLTETIPGTVSTLGLFLGAFFYLFSMDRTLPLIIVAMLPVFIFVSKYYMRHMRSLTRQVRDSDSRVQSVLQETVQNRMLIKTLESDSMMVDKLENTQSELRHNVVKRTVFSVFSNLILNFGFRLPRCLPVECHPAVSSHADLRRNDRFPTVGRQDRGPRTRPDATCSGLCQRVHSSRTPDGTGRRSAGGAGRTD